MQKLGMPFDACILEHITNNLLSVSIFLSRIYFISRCFLPNSNEFSPNCWKCCHNQIKGGSGSLASTPPPCIPLFDTHYCSLWFTKHSMRWSYYTTSHLSHKTLFITLRMMFNNNSFRVVSYSKKTFKMTRAFLDSKIMWIFNIFQVLENLAVMA